MATGEPRAFGELLRRHRLAAGLTQQSLAEKAGLSARGIADLERGVRRLPYPVTVRRLADTLRLTPTELAALLDARRRTQPTSDSQAAFAIIGQRALPVARTSFVGREHELRSLQARLRATRLLTLTGPGGVGKTRLALEVAGRLTPGFQLHKDGIHQVELAPLSDGGMIPRAVAASVGVEEIPGQPVLDTVISLLVGRQVLLILDNCEHLIGACAAVTDALLQATAGLSILATSREALNVAGEVVWPVGPLAADSDGLQLFADRARAACPTFEVTSDNQSAVVRICQQLDGLPLAIELAAARVNAFTVEEIDKRLDQCFALLTAGRRSSPMRHQTLRALVDWSYELLSSDEQRLLQQVSVFAGGWTLDAAEAVCEPTLDVLRLLPSLVDKSLVQVEQRAGLSRYRVLETLRQYGIEKLRDSQAERATRSRHLAWCERLGRTAERELFGPRQRELYPRVEAEIDNFRAALAWSLLEPGERDPGLRLAASLAHFWLTIGRGAEGSEWLERVLEHAPVSPARAEALCASGFLMVRRGDSARAHPPLAKAIALAREQEDRCLLGIALNHLGELQLQDGDLAAARSTLEESLVLTAAGADCRLYWPHYRVLCLLGELAEVERNWDAASAYLEESLILAQAQQDQWRSVILRRMGQIALYRGDLATARARFTESLRLAHEWGLADWNVAPVLAHLAGLAVAESQSEHALRLAGAANGLRDRHQARLQPIDAARLEAVIEPARRALGEVAAAKAWADGQAMSSESAVGYALEKLTATPAVAPTRGVLTRREAQVAALLGQSATNREIAAQLIISERTAKRHVENILLKLGLRSRAQVGDWAGESKKNGPTPPEEMG